MDKTKIEWCDSTWNPVTGCLHGCEYCYARQIAERFRGRGDLREAGTGFWLDKDSFEVSEGKGIYETRYALTTGERPEPFEPYKGKITPYPFGFSPTLHRYRLGEYEKKAGRTSFICMRKLTITSQKISHGEKRQSCFSQRQRPMMILKEKCFAAGLEKRQKAIIL